MGKSKRVQLNVSLYPGQDDDLIAWLEGMGGLVRGAKARQIRETLRRGIDPASGVDPSSLCDLVDRAFKSFLARAEEEWAAESAVEEEVQRASAAPAAETTAAYGPARLAGMTRQKGEGQ